MTLKQRLEPVHQPAMMTEVQQQTVHLLVSIVNTCRCQVGSRHRRVSSGNVVHAAAAQPSSEQSQLVAGHLDTDSIANAPDSSALCLSTAG